MNISGLIQHGWVTARPIVYEDFLPRSAAGIFQSNLSGEGSKNNRQDGVTYDAQRLAGDIGRDVLDPFALYEQQQNHSMTQMARELGVEERFAREP